ncbi:MAG TPA: diguanylate cyclase [Methylibium sp.]|nr:diguanylate cyclase [Methylibium sp.]
MAPPDPSTRPERPALVSLRSALLAALVLVLLALAVAVHLALDGEYRLEAGRVQADAERNAQKLAVRTRQLLDQADQITRLVKSLREAGAPVALETLQSSGLAGSELTRAVFVTDRDGLVIDTTSTSVPLHIGDEDAFKHHRREGNLGLTVGAPVPDVLDGGSVIPIMRPLHHADGGFAGVAVAWLDPAALTRDIGTGEAPGTALTVVGANDSIVRARRVDGQVSAGQRLDAGLAVERARDSAATLRPNLSPVDGRERFVAVARVDGHPLLGVVAIASDGVHAAYAATRRRVLGWAAAVAALVAAGGVGLWQQAGRLEASRRAARRAEALYAATLDGSLDALWLMRAEREHGRVIDFSVTDVNRRAGALLGLEREAMIGRRVTDLVPQVRAGGLLELLHRALAERRTVELERDGITPALAQHWMHYQIVPVADGVALIVRDVTERRRAERQLAERESFFRTLLDTLPLAVYAKSAQPATRGELLFWSRGAERQFGVPADAVVGRRSDAYLPAAQLAEAQAQDDEAAAAGAVCHFPDTRVDGVHGTRWFDVAKAPVHAPDGTVDHILVIAGDVTESRAAAERLRLMSRVVEETADAVVLSDAEDRIVFVNAAFLALTGRSAEGLIGLPATALGLPPFDDAALPGVTAALQARRRWVGEWSQARADGSRFDAWLSVSEVTDGQGRITHMARLLSDVTLWKEQERLLADLARLDPLTQLPNRRHFEEQLEQAAARARRSGRPLALVYLDLDGFKEVNDALGHEAGDQLLIEVAHRLRACVRSSDVVSRLGGDEFTVLLEDAGDDADRRRQCERLVEELSQPHGLAGRAVVCTPSVGLAVYAPGEPLDELRRRADTAMYQAKHAGKACVRVAA